MKLVRIPRSLKIIGLVATAQILSGCSVLGVEHLDAWGFKVDAAKGQDFHIGTNMIDTVDDKRGINSKEGAYPTMRRSREVHDN